MNKKAGVELGVDLITTANDPELIEVGRRAVEAALVEMRNGRISMIHRGNGLVIREKDGADSSVIRLGPEDAIRIGLTAIGKHLKRSGAAKRPI